METSMHGTILSLQICPGHRKPMATAGSAELVANLGFRGDMHALPDSSRQLLLIEKETLDALKLSAGEVKENITTSGIQLMALAPKTRLRLGADTVLEITKSCSPCSRMDEIRPGLLKEIAGRRGVLAKVITGGTIRKGDAIVVLKA
jgi:MOSC domain-containing protein YiiM